MLIFLLVSGCGQNPVDELPVPGGAAESWRETQSAPGDWNLLLITLDTTRRDHLGCYGYEPAETPVLDSLAQNGVLFESAYSTVPVTLPSHSTIMTGLNPNEHGVRNNGTFVLGEEQLTLAEVLSAQGYATGATCGAFPVDAQFGMAQGFAQYDDDFSTQHRTRAWQWLQRTAEEVTQRAGNWMKQFGHEPFFHWVHYFDPHAPYDPPPEFASRIAEPYDGEIAFMDEQIGRLLALMDDEGLLTKTWILIVGDHGESLGQHGEGTHGVFIYGATISVPFILVPPVEYEELPSPLLRGRRVSIAVGLRDAAPTVLNALGFGPETLPSSGTSLMPHLADPGPLDRVVYCESLIPNLDFGWSELRGAKSRRWSFIRAPQYELFDLEADPAESNNVIGEYPEVATRLEQWCDHFAEKGGDALSEQALDREALERLRSLGYVAGSSRTAQSEIEKDPKDYVEVLGLIRRAREAFGDQQSDVAARLYEEAQQADPGNPAVLRELASTYLRLGNATAAYALYEELMERFPGDLEICLGFSRAMILNGELKEAEQLLAVLFEEHASDQEIVSLYSELLSRTGRNVRAREVLRAAAQHPDQKVAALTQLAELELVAGNYVDATKLADDALAADSTEAGAWGIKAEAAWRDAERAGAGGQPEAAAQARDIAERYIRRALTEDPSEPRAAFRAAYLASERGDFSHAYEYYQRALSARPQWEEAHYNAGNALRAMNRPAVALRHYDIALRLGIDNAEVHLNRGVALAMMRRLDEASAAWQLALERNPDPETAAGIRRNLQRLNRR